MNIAYKRAVFVGLVAMLAVVVVACLPFGRAPSQPGRFVLLLTDAPGDFDEVLVTISEVQVNKEGQKAGTTIVDEEQEFDLMKLQHGRTDVLADLELEPGRYTQIRLIVDKARVLFDGEDSYEVFVPSGGETGIKLQINFEIGEEGTTTIIVDFDARKSIHQAPPGSGNYMMKPVLRAVLFDEACSISGTVQDDEGEPIPDATVGIFAKDEDESLSETTTDEDGYFKVAALEEGTYDVVISADGYLTAEFKGDDAVEVKAGDEVYLGTIELEEEE